MDIGASSGHHSGILLATSTIAILFGIIYAILIGWIKQKRRLDGYASIAVVMGVSVTLFLSSFIIGIENAVIVILLFICTGVPMIVGSWWDYTNTRNKAADTLRQIMGGNDGNQA